MNPNTIREPFWSISIEETLKMLETSAEGLSEEDAAGRLKTLGPNIIGVKEGSSAFELFINQFKSPLIFILILAGITTTFLDDYVDAVVIFSAVLINVMLGFYQENKAENVLELLKSYVKTLTRVRRKGKEEVIDASRLVPGDVIRIAQGDKIPADGRVIFANNFEVDESVLTGESIPVEKKTDTLEASAPLSDRTSMVFGSTLALRGFADVVVVSTGIGTEFGKIAALLSAQKKSKTPLQEAISSFAYLSGIILLVLTIVLFGLGIYLKYSPLEMFLISVAVAVSAVPEGLPIALTVIMAVGVEQLAKRNGVVRKLLAAETLGSTSLILTDKTGTLTQAKMELTAVVPYDKGLTKDENTLLRKALMSVDVLIENPTDAPDKWRTFGNFMETALVNGARNKNVLLTDVVKNYKIIDRAAFSSDKKFSASVYSEGSVMHLIVLGAPEIILGFTSLSDSEREEITNEINKRAYAGERVLGVVSNGITPGYENLHHGKFKNLNFDGLLSFRDPLRPGVAKTIERIKRAGVRTIILTGDHKGTAEAVGRELGLINKEEIVLTGNDINNLSHDELMAAADKVAIYARVTPEQKVLIAKLYQSKGEIVAMTGDGVNDAPAMNTADIGVALGSGTDVTKSAADLVILDNNYETIVAAIEEGRRMIDNIKKVIVYLLSNSFDEIFLIGGSILTGLALPISAIQILYVNFFSDSFPAVAFAFDKGVDEIGTHPRRLSRSILDYRMKFFILGIGILTSALLFIIYWSLEKSGLPIEMVRTFIFMSFATYTLIMSFSLRSLRKGIFYYNPFSNSYLIFGVLVGIGLTIAAVYVPFLNHILGTKPLPLNWLSGVAGIGIFNIMTVELGKWFLNYVDRKGKEIE